MVKKISTPADRIKNSKIALKEVKDNLIKLVIEENEIKNKKNELLNEICFWESMIK